MSIFVHWILMLLGIFGVIEISGILLVWLHRPKIPPHCMMVVPLEGKIENPEQLLRYIREVAQWSPESQRAILLDMGLAEESKRACEALCGEDSRVEFCTREQICLICKYPSSVL